VFTINPLTRIETANAKTHYVGDIGEYTTIQEAINNATTGDTIYVYSGIYYETINITKDGLTIQGENRENTIIDGTSSAIDNSTAFIHSHNDITIKNFKIRNSNNHGIYAQNANNIEISNCEIYDNEENGINFYNVNDIEINNSEIYYNYYDGIHIVGTTIGSIENCYIYDNYDSGILIELSNNIDITNSIIDYNNYGIKLKYQTNNVTITYCNITDNNIGLSIGQYCINNIIYLNNFVLNNKNSESFATNIWDNGTFGNYWDDYTGKDTNSNGTGDTPYTKNGVNDNYPLIHSYGSVINENTGEIFLTIQAAVDDTNTISGHTIFVEKDTYYENIVVPKDGITILGEDKYKTIIDAGNQDMNGILIKNHDYVTIKEFTIRNSPDSNFEYSNGILIWAFSPPMSGNNHSNHNTISDCIIKNNGKYGILIYGSYGGQKTNSNIISDCEIYENGYSGIRITNDYKGGGYSTADNNQITNCELYDNGYYGYLDEETAAITISPDGVVTNTQITDCLIYYSEGYDIHITTGETVENNIIYHNNFLSNTNNTYDKGNNFWYNSTLQEGNYWACYDEPSEEAYDNDTDGIIDEPYDIPEGNNRDLYPLAAPLFGITVPVADANGPYNAEVNQSITFDGSGSYDLDGDYLDYTWDLGNGETIYGKNPTYSYPTAGTYTVTLTVEDWYGLTDTATTTASIIEEEPEEPENEPPVADAGGPYYEFAGVAIQFDGSNSDDEDGTSISYKWNFGDGSTSTQEMPSHAYSQAGNYTVTLTVTDEDGATDTDTTSATITKKPNNPPEKPIVNGTKTGHINISYNYTANASDPDGDMIQYIFNWSDGTNDTKSPLMNSNEQFNTSHNWTVGGIYIVTVYTIDENNATSDTQPLKVLIDAHYCGSIGYLIDKNGNGTYDVFYRETTGKETETEKNGDKYYIDINNDEEWDYIYNFTTNRISNYPTASVSEEKENSFSLETKWILLIVFIVAVLIFSIAKIAIYKSQKPKETSKKEAKDKKIKKLEKEVDWILSDKKKTKDEVKIS
jgi:parallel beta-helix repeat protein